MARVQEAGASPAHAQNFASLRKERENIDNRLLTWVTSLEASWLAEVLTYTSKTDGKARTVPKWAPVVQMFNHQTHHRGQITTLLAQMGLDVGSTDIPFMPRFQLDEAA